MPSIKQIDPSELPTTASREGKVSTKLFREFLDSGAQLAQVELDEGPDAKSLASTRSTLANYVNRHNLAVRVFARGDNLYIEKCEATEGGELVGVVTGRPQREERGPRAQNGSVASDEAEQVAADAVNAGV